MTQRTEAEVWLEERDFRPFNDWRPWDGPRSEVLEQIQLRDEFIARFGYAILTSDAIAQVKRTLGEDARILEVGAGSGYWSYEFLRAGEDCIASDPGNGGYIADVSRDFATKGRVESRRFVDVQELTGLEALERYGHERALMMVWPDNDSWPAEILREYGGQLEVLCGEPAGEACCTGGEKLFELLDREWVETDQICIPNFFGINDYIGVYSRRRDKCELSHIHVLKSNAEGA